MVASVEKYGGFYIARYEAAVVGGETVSKKGVIPAERPWGNGDDDMANNDHMLNYEAGSCVGLSRGMYDGTNITSVKPTLIYGTQWDATLEFVKTEKDIINSTTWGNYTFPDDITPSATGSNHNYISKNIFDLSGNQAEWTMEAYSTSSRVIRGGSWNSGFSGSVSERISSYHHYSTIGVGFRVTLYLV